MKSSPTSAKNLLFLDVKHDLSRIDSIMGNIINEKGLQRRFLKNPCKMMIESGLIPPQPTANVSLSNKLFYGVLANQKLMRHVIRDFPRVKIDPSVRKKIYNKLRKGKIYNDLRADEIFVHSCANHPAFMKKLFQLALYDLNRKKMLPQTYTKADIDRYIAALLSFLRASKPPGDQPVLAASRQHKVTHKPRDEYSSSVLANTYVISNLVFHLSIAVTVEGLVGATVVAAALFIIPVDILGIGDPFQFPIADYANIFGSNVAAIRVIQTIERVLSFTSDLALFVQNDSAYSGKQMK